MITFLRLVCQDPEGQILLNIDDISSIQPSQGREGSFIKFRGVQDGLYVNENIQQIRNNLLATESENIEIL